MTFAINALRGAGGVVDHRLARRHVISEFRRGRLRQDQVCDAHPELIRAAKNIGSEATSGWTGCQQIALRPCYAPVLEGPSPEPLAIGSDVSPALQPSPDVTGIALRRTFAWHNQYGCKRQSIMRFLFTDPRIYRSGLCLR